VVRRESAAGPQVDCDSIVPCALVPVGATSRAYLYEGATKALLEVLAFVSLTYSVFSLHGGFCVQRPVGWPQASMPVADQAPS
jgi:hypothetical protein